MQFFHRYAVVQVLEGFGQNGVGVSMLFQPDTSGRDQIAYFADVQQTGLAVFHHVQLRRHDVSLAGTLLGTFFHTLGAIQHISAGHVMFARAHQRQFDLVLDIFNMERTAGWLTTHQRRHHVGRQLLDHFAHTRRSRPLAAVDCQKSLGNRDRNLRWLETDDSAIAADDPVFAQTR